MREIQDRTVRRQQLLETEMGTGGWLRHKDTTKLKRQSSQNKTASARLHQDVADQPTVIKPFKPAHESKAAAKKPSNIELPKTTTAVPDTYVRKGTYKHIIST